MTGTKFFGGFENRTSSGLASSCTTVPDAFVATMLTSWLSPERPPIRALLVTCGGAESAVTTTVELNVPAGQVTSTEPAPAGAATLTLPGVFAWLVVLPCVWLPLLPLLPLFPGLPPPAGPPPPPPPPPPPEL